MSVFRKFKQVFGTIKYLKLSRCYSTAGKFERHDETLTGRLISYLDYNKNETSVSKSLKILKSLQDTKLSAQNLKLQELRSCIKLANEPKILSTLDQKCCQIINELTPQETCDLLHSFVQNTPQKIVTLNFYSQAITTLFNNLENLNKEELVQLIFFTGLQKKTKQAQSILRKCLRKLTPVLHELDSNQLCIISSAIFKTSTRVDEKLLSFVTHYINTNLLILTDPPLFITFIKLIRLNKYQTEELLTNISCAIFFNNTTRFYNVPDLCHILALYADHLYYDEKLFDCFVAKCLEQLKDQPYNPELTYLLNQPRIKDINRLIWCLAHVNYQNITKEQLREVVQNIIKRIEAGECDKNPDILIEIFLNLWLLNYRAYELVPYAFIESHLRKIQESSSPVKPRLNLLLTLLYNEDAELYEKIDIEPLRYTTYLGDLQVQRRPVLQRVMDSLKNIAKTSDVNRFEFGCQIPHLSVVGITGYKRKIYKAVYIEVLDDYTMVKNTDSLACGIMQTKLRLLDKSEEGLIVVDSKEICDMTEFELQQHLEDSINLVT